MSSTKSFPPLVQGDSRSGKSVREHRAAATTAGILFIIGTVAGILSKAAVLSEFANQQSGSPTLRGKFIREALMCLTIPPPPPGGKWRVTRRSFTTATVVARDERR